jgi:glycyl-tRNA synthetase
LTSASAWSIPWLQENGIAGAATAPATAPASVQQSPSETVPILDTPASFLLEIGTEELPAGDLEAALRQLESRLPALLDELRLSHGELRILGTPRRLVAYVEDLAPRQPDRQQVIKGPPAARAFDSLGEPTQAALGFARSKGVSPADLQTREMDGGSYVVAVVQEGGRPTDEVLVESLPGLVASLRFDKAMRWNHSNVAFSRPIRWLLALFAGRPLSFEYAGLRSTDLTRGLRFHQPSQAQIDSPESYFAYLAEQGILLDVEERRRHIRSQVEALASEVDGSVPEDASLLAEVTNLVESPLALRGSFDPSHLELPREVLISVMKKHQRYFPVQKDGALLPYFIAVANRDLSQPQDLELVVEGNQHVIRARFADAAFFVDEDLKQPLDAYLPMLKTLIFQVQLGSMYDKTRRIQALTGELAGQLDLSPDEVRVAARAAELCKADLATKMVVEMTSLQGSMGRYYALRSGESQAVADAIFEHYLPRSAGDRLPQALAGLVVGLADRLDTLAGLFAAGLAPTGAKDPFAQRRAALGLVQSLIGRDLDFNLRSGLELAASHLPIPASPESQAACLSFIIERLRNLFLEGGFRYDVVEAVLAAQGHNPAGAARAAGELSAWVARSDWHTILPAYARCVRITRDQAERYPLDPGLLSEPAERDLFAALQEAEAAPRRPGSVDDFLAALLPMIPYINDFFDRVLVMDEDQRLRRNRLGLLQRLSALAGGVADMSRLEGF